MVARWLPISAVASRLHLPLEEVQALAEAEVLHEEWIHDHWSISEASVADYQRFLAEQQPAPSYRGGPPLDPQTEFEYEQERKK